MPDTYGWDFPEIPSVTLKPGEHFEQNFLLEMRSRLTKLGITTSHSQPSSRCW